MDRCDWCLMPFTKPGLEKTWIGESDICRACFNYSLSDATHWDLRQKELREICDKHRDVWDYDCIVPVSGGKDSHWLVKTLVEDYNMHPLLVTVNDNFAHTRAGEENLKNLRNKYNLNHIAWSMSDDLFIRSCRWAFEQEGQPLKLIEYAIYLIPYMIAKEMGIPLVFFGEDSGWLYGTRHVEDRLANNKIWFDARLLEKEIEWWAEGGIKKEEIYKIYVDVGQTPYVYWMSYFYPWSSLDHLEAAKKIGFKDLGDTGEWERQGTVDNFEQIDSYGYLVHLWLRYPRHGYQRTTDIVSRRIREGKMTKERGLDLIKKHDCCLDKQALLNFCTTLGYTQEEFWKIVRSSKWNSYWVDL